MSKIEELNRKRRGKYKAYINTDYRSWKKKLRKLQLDNIDLKIKMEKLKSQYK